MTRRGMKSGITVFAVFNAALLASAAVAFADPAPASGAIEQVVVTATKRSQNVQTSRSPFRR